MVFVMVLQPEVGLPQFIANWWPLDGGAQIFWVSHIGPRDEAKTFKFTLRLKSTEGRIIAEGTRPCVPCDVTPDEMERKCYGIVLAEAWMEEAERDDGYIYYG